MDISLIPVLSVSYNAPDLIDELLSSFRKFYANRFVIIDGSDSQHFPLISEVCSKYPEVTLHHFDYNIHHGPGLAWAFRNLELDHPVLVLDSDVVVLQHGFLESMYEALKPDMYGVGSICLVNEDGFNVKTAEGIRYLHPACMLCNPQVVRSWAMPTKHGAPLIEPMLEIHRSGRSELIGDISWIGNDFQISGAVNKYLKHDWQGTVKRTGGYHLEEWQASMQSRKSPAPSIKNDAEDLRYNRDLIQLIPEDAKNIVEIGCNNGALACAYKLQNPKCLYVGVEVNEKNADLARAHCDHVDCIDIETAGEGFFLRHRNVDTWVFGDVLEHLRDPWTLLARIRKILPPNGRIVICLPNAQHWSVQANLSIGNFRYQDWGLLDRTHLRFFTRITMLEMVAQAGYTMQLGYPRILGETVPPGVENAIKSMAIAMGMDPEQTYQDSLPTQYVIRIVPLATTLEERK